MFGSIIKNKYGINEVESIVNYLEDICSPNDGIGWSSSGIYCFWDFYTKEILYIGLAIDLKIRFMQHNGLTTINENACKKAQIANYFGQKELLGFSLFVQSANEQPKLMRNRELLKNFSPSDQQAFELIGESSYNNVKRMEGILIESYRLTHGTLPPWNRVGGSIDGQRVTMPSHYDIVDMFSNDKRSTFVSKYSLRELSEDATALYFEESMHAIRMDMLNLGLSFEKAVKQFSITNQSTYHRMIEEGYFSS